ncbi:uncharacterized protein PHACADRAFT_213853 [Phanerochaete carnosa HHB-10118-sp]|uniref:RTA1 like protein n=1 Tax=Phanerochaete carnosa (strain HHB-10118-sp) TaxID=650164 RepID=K5UKE3_PHACS|nr:uncharacterized protein PHACADRAFT_213853 [Phanerochaete carnosa HHB-10118-sp]EKM50091.1 hypothetical protein PHACADRAFT_213853 [Phanerochaete carnosa HHB-10118-sp]
MNSTTSFAATIPPNTNLYHYTPTKSLCYLFLILFSLSTAGHVFFAFRYRLWWIFPTIVLAGAGEIAGWVSRAVSSNNPTIQSVYIIQSTCLVLAPTALLASIFIIFARLSECVGSRYGRLTSRLYSRIFLTCDIVALLIQGNGGGLAASAKTESLQKLGSDIMLVGIIFQTVAMIVFIILASEFFYRYFKDLPARPEESYYNPSRATGRIPLSRNLKLMIIGLSLAMLFLLIRGFYRIFELADGWNGRIISTQWLFSEHTVPVREHSNPIPPTDTFDGAMIVLAMYTLNVFHPGPLLSGSTQDSASSSEADKPVPVYGHVETLQMRAV